MLNMNSFRSTPLQQRGAGYRLVRKDSELVRNKCELNLLFFFFLESCSFVSAYEGSVIPIAAW